MRGKAIPNHSNEREEAQDWMVLEGLEWKQAGTSGNVIGDSQTWA